MKRLFLIVLFAGLAFVPKSAKAATSLYLNADVWTVGVGQETRVQVSIDTDQGVNAFRVAIQYPIDLLEYVDWSNGGSVISHWVASPSGKNGTLAFEGVAPGGFSGTNGLLATLTFRGVLPGIGWIRVLPDSRILLNDGQGTQESYTAKDMRFRVVNASEAQQQLPYSSIFKDTVPPEPFTPFVAQDKDTFNGKWFVTFETQDKDSGVDHYDVAENALSCDFVAQSAWHREQSPYTLRDQGLRSYICVRAVDKSGNVRIESIVPRAGGSYAGINPWVILGIIACALLVVLFNVLKSRFHHHG